jgi:chaperonin cofactor prefoldin
MTVEQILNAFQKHLESDTAAFVSESVRVLEQDASLRRAQSDLVSLATHAQKLCVQQSDLQSQVEGIEAQQDALDAQLRLAEQVLDGLFASQSHLSPVDADVQREKSYTAAIAIDQRLSALTDQLQSSLRMLDDAATATPPTTGAGGGGTGSQDEGKLVAILNQHQNALAELELTTHRVERDMKRIAQALAAPPSS